jgi:hypothetical protein
MDFKALTTKYLDGTRAAENMKQLAGLGVLGPGMRWSPPVVDHDSWIASSNRTDPQPTLLSKQA